MNTRKVIPYVTYTVITIVWIISPIYQINSYPFKEIIHYNCLQWYFRSANLLGCTRLAIEIPCPTFLSRKMCVVTFDRFW